MLSTIVNIYVTDNGPIIAASEAAQKPIGPDHMYTISRYIIIIIGN